MRILYLVALSLIVISAPGYAQEAIVPGCMGQHQFGGGHGFESLGLTAEQKTQIDEIEIATQKAIIPVKAEMELKRIDLEKEMKLDKPNRDRVMKMVKDIHALELQVKQAMIDQQLNIHGILTPEQRAKMRESMHQRMGMNMMGRQMGMHGAGQSDMMMDPCSGCKGQGAMDKPCPQHQTEKTDK